MQLMRFSLLNFTSFSNSRHYVTFFMLASVKSSQKVSNMEPEKCEGWSWLPWEQIAAMNPEEIFVPIQNLIKSGCTLQRASLARVVTE
jgi:8-oxo-dGTP diphosphatase